MEKKRTRPAAESRYYTPSVYRDILAKMGVVVSYTNGVSMRPLIRTGRHYVAIVPVEGEPAIDDILLFEQVRHYPANRAKGTEACIKTMSILHRLVEIDRSGDETVYVTRGDNCLACERITRADIIGKVSEIYRVNRDKPKSVTDKGYLRYVRFWNAIWPLRKQFYRLRALAARIYHKLF